MDKNRTLNKAPEINVYPIQNMKYLVKGNILYVTSCPKNLTFILTDGSLFYVIENGKDNKMKEYNLVSTIKKEKNQYQTNEIVNQIWCHKLGGHAIIKYNNDVYYYNPYLAKDKVQEVNLFTGNKYLQPYSVAFDDDYLEINDTGEILFSDYYSDIYKLQITTKDQNVIPIFGKIFSLGLGDKNEDEIEDDLNDFSLFKMEKNDRILDMKLISSSQMSIQNVTKGKEGKNIFIMAITNSILFQFYGKDSFENVFQNYSIKKGDINKAYKKFLGNPKIENFTYSRIQLINQYMKSANEAERKEKRGFSFGFMTKCGYCVGKLKGLQSSTSQNAFTVFDYSNPRQKEYERQIGKELITNIKIVCQSINHIFFLYKDCLVILNKLTNRIIHSKYLEQQFIDIYYDEILNSIILYTKTDVYKIPLDEEFNYLWIDYVEIGNYELALKTLTREYKYMKPKLHKLYAEHLFKEKKYLESAIQYAFSDEKFEHVCLKFLTLNNHQGLTRYLFLINQFRINKSDEKSPINFIEKYLVNTWLLELLIGKHENCTSNELIGLIKLFARNQKHGNNYLDIRFLYYILRIYGRNKEFAEFAAIKGDVFSIILSLLKLEKYTESLKYIKSYASSGQENLNDIFQIFYSYGNLFIKYNPKETIEILENFLKFNKTQEEIIRILIDSTNINIITNYDNFKIIIDYIRKMILKPFRYKNAEINFVKNKNLHNLYILFLSNLDNISFPKKSLKEQYQEELNKYIKRQITLYSFSDNSKNSNVSFDLYFAKKIFSSNPNILCLIYFLLGQYNDSIDIALTNNLEDNLQLISKNISEPKLKKKIWLKIFNYKKKEGFEAAKKIVNNSNGFIKIEDIIPLMGDNVKINEFKTELMDCINNYGRSMELLKKEIDEFNYSNSLIQIDINKAHKRAINLNYTFIRCHKCGNLIHSSIFFMFPCKHIFDTKCLIDTYNEYNNQGLGDTLFNQKVNAIEKLLDKIDKLKGIKTKNDGGKNEGNKKKAMSNQNQLDMISEQQESQLKIFNKGLFDFLDEECLLCGNEIIKSTQIPFPEQNSMDWEIL